MSNSDIRLRAGDWVEVKSPAEIAQTLNEDGTLDGLPFMPEMAEYCGRRFQVVRLAEKTCVEYVPWKLNMREFRQDNVVILDVARCCGTHHDGCERACVLFWKKAWLRKAEKDRAPAPTDPTEDQRLRSILKSQSAPGQYFCQSTQLEKATKPMSRGRVVLKCLYDLHSGSRGLFEMARLVFFPLFRFATGYRFPRPLGGTLKKTPVGNLGLRAGEWVRIKRETEIVQTLDRLGRNRGMICDRGLTQYEGGSYRVRNRLDRMISEPTGEMRKLEGTVILEGLNCHCWWRRVGGCPREDFMYWREVWLERVEGAERMKVNQERNGWKATR